jgi:hypothetical protein
MFIWNVTGLSPINGSLKRSMLQRLAALAGFFSVERVIVDEAGPGRVSGPPAAWRLVIVDDAAETGRAPAFGLDDVSFLNQSARDVLGFAGSALAMVFSVLRGLGGGVLGPPS